MSQRNNQFYYHTDHLGSATLITDDDADVVQQIAYLPYGEDWIDVRSSSYFGSAYKFNGKEKDDETSYSYYGARYYTDRLSIWLSVDPLADKYPHLSPYAYCADNPVMLVDPDGRASGPPDRVQSAYNMIGTKYKQESTSSLRTGNSKQAMEYMDCTEFVARVMAADEITENVMNIGGKSRVQAFFGNENIFENDFTPQVGDVAGWDGHWGIVSAVDDNGNIKLTHAANSKRGAIENSSFISPSKYSSGKFLGFFRPKVETKDGKVIPKHGAKVMDMSKISITLSEVTITRDSPSSHTSYRVNVEAVKPSVKKNDVE